MANRNVVESFTKDTESESELYAFRTSYNPLFYSNIEEQYIVNAVNGMKYTWKVGTYDELRLFKVKDVSQPKTNYSGRTSQTAFYKDPYEYMIHNNVKLPDDVIEKWKMRISNLKEV